MTKHEIVKLMAVIKIAYPEFNRENDDTVSAKLWYSMLEPYSYEMCDSALLKHIETCKFAPKISEIIERVKTSSPALPESFINYPTMEGFLGNLRALYNVRGWLEEKDVAGIDLPDDMKMMVRREQLESSRLSDGA